MEKRRKSASLLPVGVFLVFYLGLGILFEYIMKIPMGFYNVPIVVRFWRRSWLRVCRTERLVLMRSWRSWDGESEIRILSQCC